MTTPDQLADALREWVDYFDELQKQSYGDPLALARERYHGQRLKKAREALAAYDRATPTAPAGGETDADWLEIFADVHCAGAWPDSTRAAERERFYSIAATLRAAAAVAAENERLKDLVLHCWMHSGCRDCGFSQMSSDQKQLYESVIAAFARAALTESERNDG